MEDLASCTSFDAVQASKKPKTLPHSKDDAALDNRVQHAAKDPRQPKFSKVSFSNIILSMLFIKNCCKNDEVSRMFWRCSKNAPKLFPNDCFVQSGQSALDNSDVALDKVNPVQHASKDPRQSKLSKVSVLNIILSTLCIKNCCKNDEVSRMFWRSFKNVPVPRTFPNDCSVQNFLQLPQQKTIMNDLNDDEDEPEKDLPKSPATPTGESVNDDLHNFSLSELNVSFQWTFPEYSQNTIYENFCKLYEKTFMERFENGFYCSYCSVLFQPSFFVDPTAEALDAMLKTLECMDGRLQRVEGQLVHIEEGIERIEDSFALNNSRKTQGDDAVKTRSELPLLTVEAFHAFERQLANSTMVRTTINVPKTFQTRSQFVICVSLENLQCSKNVPKTFQTRSQFVICVSLENLQSSKDVPETFQTLSQFVSAKDAERGNQVLFGKETSMMCPGACEGALSHCVLLVPKARHHYLRMLRENNISCDYHQCKWDWWHVGRRNEKDVVTVFPQERCLPICDYQCADTSVTFRLNFSLFLSCFIWCSTL